MSAAVSAVAEPPVGRSLRLLRAALGAVAFVVVVEAGLGFAGASAAAAPLVGLAGLLAVALLTGRAWRRRHDDGGASPPWTAAERVGGSAVAVALLTRLGEGLHPDGDGFPYDVLSYHLHLPAAWRAVGRVGIVATPFGDQAPAFAPSNAELTYRLAMSVTGNLRLAHAGQAPFAALAALALFATVRQLGASRLLGCAAALAFLMVPEIWQQATGAMSDLVLASFFLGCLPFLVRLQRARAAADIGALGLALGLVLGTKYVGAALLMPLAGCAFCRLARARPGLRRGPAALILFLAMFACGGFWYLRNLLLTGDPTFPVTLRLGPWTLAPGLYDGAAMRAWRYHLPVRDLHPLLEMFIETGWGFFASGAAALVVASSARRLLAPLTFAVVLAVGWLIVPYQQSRFLFAAWGVAAVMMVEGARRLPAAVRPLALVPAIVGGALQFPTPARLLVAGLWGTAALLAARVERASAPTPRRRPTPWWTPTLAAVTVLGGIAWARARPNGQPYRIGDHHDDAWAFVREHVRGRRVAYAGSNLPLPLWGWNLENTVRYVNVSGRASDVLQDFRTTTQVTPPSAEPAPERADPDRQAWLGHLEVERIEVLFVSRLYPDVEASMPHDGDGFPVERAWADALPARFHPLFTSPAVRIYGLSGEAPP